MARTGITFEQVEAAADAIRGEGLQPTINAVRERLGTGSPNTIHRHLTAWRSARPQAVTVTTELPASLTNAIATEIERAAASARAEIESKLVQAQTEAAELATVGEALEAERDELIEQVAGLTTERDTLAGKAEQQAADIKAQAERIEREQQAAEAARVELARAQLKIESSVEKLADQAAEVKRLRDALDTETKSRIVAEQQAAVLTAKLEAMRERATDIETRTAAEITALKAERQDLPTMLKTLMDKIGTVKTNNQHPNADRQNEDLFSDDSLENIKPTATPAKRRKAAKSLSEKI